MHLWQIILAIYGAIIIGFIAGISAMVGFSTYIEHRSMNAGR
jgi:hypothetical protein